MTHYMESIVDEGTPLAAFLQGAGTAESSPDRFLTPSRSETPPLKSFAPLSSQTFRARLQTRVPKQLRIIVPKDGRISQARDACSRAINSQLGRAENTKFIEHFRYVLIASQLLNEYQDHGSLQACNLSTTNPDGHNSVIALHGDRANTWGAVFSAGVAFVLVALVQWARSSKSSTTRSSRLMVVVLCIGTVAAFVYAFMRRQWLKHVRIQAVEAASALTVNLQAFELSSNAALSLIQEVELVSRGYRISTPLPPISRLEDPNSGKRCVRLRRTLHKLYSSTIPAFRSSIELVRTRRNEDDYERFLDIYDVSREAIKEACAENLLVEELDGEALGTLRMMAYQYSTLRRALLCSLLSLEADGGRPDFARWRTATETMESLSRVTANNATILRDVLKELEDFATPTTPKAASKLSSERLRGQVRKIGTLSQGIRSLQAKMTLLREESNKTIEESEDLTDLGPGLLAQYESIGADLKHLVQAWETGKMALATNLDKHERRISMASSGIRSPVSSLGGLTAVDEGGPAEALKALMGESGHSDRSSIVTTPSDEEVFEAIAMPKQRSTLTREQRIMKVQEDRVRQAELQEKRMSSTSMIRELQSVINLRQPRRNTEGRITSI